MLEMQTKVERPKSSAPYAQGQIKERNRLYDDLKSTIEDLQKLSKNFTTGMKENLKEVCRSVFEKMEELLIKFPKKKNNNPLIRTP